MLLAADCLTVLGLALLTIGTAAQAAGALAEFKKLWRTLSQTKSEVKVNEITALFGPRLFMFGLRNMFASMAPDVSLKDGLGRFYKGYFTVVFTILRSITRRMVPSSDNIYIYLFRWGTALNRIHARGGEAAEELARFYRQVRIWGILTFGSGFIFVAAVLTLIRDA